MNNNKQQQQNPLHQLLHTEEFLEHVEQELHYHHPELAERQYAIANQTKLPFCLRRVEESATLDCQTFVLGPANENNDEAAES